MHAQNRLNVQGKHARTAEDVVCINFIIADSLVKQDLESQSA